MARHWGTRERRDTAMVGIDVGSVNVRVVVASVEPQMPGPSGMRRVYVHGLGEAPTQGVRRGVVLDAARLSTAVRAAVQQAEERAGHRILSAYLVASLPMLAERATGGDGKRIVLSGADAVRGTIRQPLEEVSLWAEVAAASGLMFAGAVPSALAAMAAVVLPEEQTGGVALVECGAEHTSVAVFAGGTVRRLGMVPVGGDHITRDLAALLGIRPVEAERLKLEIGQSRTTTRTEIMARGDDGTRKTIAVSLIAAIIEARVEQIFRQVAEVLRQRDDADFTKAAVTKPASVVLCGGGAALSGIAHTARATLGVPVRIAGPCEIAGSVAVHTPEYGAALGVVRWWDAARSERHGRTTGAHGHEEGQKLGDQPIRMGQNRWQAWLREFLP